MSIPLYALPDYLELNAVGEIRSQATLFLEPFYLTDPQGNRLTDPQGNYLVGYVSSTVYPLSLHALPDFLDLNAEQS